MAVILKPRIRLKPSKVDLSLSAMYIAGSISQSAQACSALEPAKLGFRVQELEFLVLNKIAYIQTPDPKFQTLNPPAGTGRGAGIHAETGAGVPATAHLLRAHPGVGQGRAHRPGPPCAPGTGREMLRAVQMFDPLVVTARSRPWL